MSVALLVMTNGRRDCIERTIPSALDNLRGDITRFLIHDDSGDLAYQEWLSERFPCWGIVRTPGRLGFGGAIRSAWSFLADGPEPYVFHLEDDFVFNRHVPLALMADALEHHSYLAQIALRRQSWNAAEAAAGGVVEQRADEFTETGHDGSVWLEHRCFFTTNPSLYRRSLCKEPWPEGARSEGMFTQHLLTSPETRFAYWGGRTDGANWVEHIGRERVGTGY